MAASDCALEETHRSHAWAERSVRAAVLLAALVVLSGAGASADAECTRGPARFIRGDRSQGPCPEGTSELFVQNVDMDSYPPVSAVADFYLQGDADRASIALTLAEHAWRGRIALGERSNLRTGPYAAIVSSRNGVGAVSRTTWPACGAVVMDNASEPSTAVIVPYVVKDRDDETSIVAIANADTGRTAAASVAVQEGGADAPVLTLAVDIAPAGSVTLDLASDTRFASLPAGFLGWLRVAASSPVAVQAWIAVARPVGGVYGFEGVPDKGISNPSGLAAAAVYSEAPAVADAGPEDDLSSRIAIVNPEGTQGALSLRLRGQTGSCAGRIYQVTYPLTGTHTVVDLAPGAVSYGQASPLPRGCVAGAIIVALGPPGVVGTVLSSNEAGNLTSAYNPEPPGSGGWRFVPLFRKSSASDSRTTVLSVMDYIADEPAVATIELWDGQGNPIAGCGKACTIDVGQARAARWSPEPIDAIAPGTVGWARIATGLGLAVVVEEVTLSGRGGIAAYGGLAGRSGSYPTAEPWSHLPLLLCGGETMPTTGPPPTERARTPTPSPSPGPSVPPSPSASSTPSPTPSPSRVPMATPTQLVSWCGGPGGPPLVCPRTAGTVPSVVVTYALVNPERVSGWGERRNPGIPYDAVHNPCRNCLAVQNPGVAFHPLFNGLVWAASCR